MKITIHLYEQLQCQMIRATTTIMYILVAVTGEKLVAADVTVAEALVVVSDLGEDDS